MPRIAFGIRSLSLLAATLLLASITLAPAAASTESGGVAWSVQTADNEHGTGRANFAYEVDPGEVLTDMMVVTNTGTVVLPLEVYAADAFTTTGGSIDLLAGDVPSVDAGRWVATSATSLTLAPGDSVEIPFTITVPDDATPGDHAAGLITSLVSQDASQSLEVDRRLGSRINLRVAGDLVPAAVVTVMATEALPSLNPFAPTTLQLTYRVENVGNTRITGTDVLVAHTVAGLLSTTRIEPQLPEVLPRSTIEVVREVPVTSLGWLGGTLTVAMEGVGLGAGSIEPATVEFSTVAIPWSLLIVLVIAAGAAIGVLLWVRSAQRTRTEGATHESSDSTGEPSAVASDAGADLAPRDVGDPEA